MVYDMMPDINTWCPPHRVKKFESLLKRMTKAAKQRNVHFKYSIGKPKEVIYNFEDLPLETKYGSKLVRKEKDTDASWRYIVTQNARDIGFRFDKIQKEWLRTECSVSIEHSDFSPSGWSALAILEKAEGSNRVLVKKIPNVEDNLIDYIPDEWNGDCQHCNMNRKRNSTILVKSPKGEVRQVGTSCLFEYTGMDPQLIASFYATMESKVNYPTPWSEEAWEAYMDYLAEMGYGGGGPPPSPEWPLTHFLVVCHRLFSFRGAYIKGMGATILKSRVRKIGERYFIEDQHTGIELEIHPPNDEYYEVADEIITYVKHLKVRTDFEYNLQTVVDSNFVSKKTAGFAAAMWFVWNRAKEQGRLEQLFNPIETEGKHLGEIGERIEFDATVTKKVGSMGYFGETTMFIFQTDDGDDVIWWSSSKKKDLPQVGDYVKVKGRVKKHGDFKGKNNTSITRPTIQKY